MKLLFLIAATMISVQVIQAKHFWSGTLLKTEEVKKRWGDNSFNEKAFSDGSLTVRASMAFDIIKNKNKFIKTSVLDLRKKLGAPDGHYFSDTIPAYIIYEAKNKNESSWQIVFTIDEQRNITDVFVHKNCCDDSPN